jgi:hypothetical protein
LPSKKGRPLSRRPADGAGTAVRLPDQRYARQSCAYQPRQVRTAAGGVYGDAGARRHVDIGNGSANPGDSTGTSSSSTKRPSWSCARSCCCPTTPMMIITGCDTRYDHLPLRDDRRPRHGELAPILVDVVVIAIDFGQQRVEARCGREHFARVGHPREPRYEIVERHRDDANVVDPEIEAGLARSEGVVVPPMPNPFV